jgi:hypothetical protein
MFTTDQQHRIAEARSVDIVSLIGTEGLHKSGREWVGPCIFCGTGVDRFSIQPHQNTWLCRYCTAGKYSDTIDFVRRRDGLDFVEAVNLLASGTLPVVARPVLAPRSEPDMWHPPYWARHATRHVMRFVGHPHKVQLWQAYKPLSRETIERRRLGVGVLPASRCEHPRLIVPVYEETELVALRGRRISCDCENWLMSAGSKKALYGLDDLEHGCVVWVVENNVDRLLLEETYRGEGWCALSPTTGAMTRWPEEWIERLCIAEVEQVIVAFDNDEAGDKAGKRLVSELRRTRLHARRWEWPDDAPPKADIGWFLMQRTT